MGTETVKKGELEKTYLSQGKLIVGVDEVGRGCLAGPVVAGAVILDYQKLFCLDTKSLGLIRDSKKLSSLQRKAIIPTIESVKLASGLAESDPREIERLGIVEATFLAMRRAIKNCTENLEIQPDLKERLERLKLLVLVDGREKISKLEFDQLAHVKGDSKIYAISAASILAKEMRDEKMSLLNHEFPGYDFASHVGYGTQNHLDSLNRLGPCSIHRRNFAPIKNMIVSISPN